MHHQSPVSSSVGVREKRSHPATQATNAGQGKALPDVIARAVSTPLHRYSPPDMLALQRTVGNRQVSRMLSHPAHRPPSALVQRLDMSERPLETMEPPLANVKQLVGGHKGDVYLLTNQASQRLVVKFQNESPKEAIVGTMIMQKAGATTPRVRIADPADMKNIHAGFGASDLLPKFGEVIRQFLHAEAKFTNILLMDFAEGQTIMKMMDEDPQKCARALKDRQFQFGLGRILAADAIAGNPDRAMAIEVRQDKLAGWYHEQNLFINEVRGQWGDFTAVAIDNAFSPGLTSLTAPYGRHAFYGQLGSVAAASPQHFGTEAGLIYDRMLKEFTNKHPKDPQVKTLVADLQKSRGPFVANVSSTAAEVMQSLIGTRKQGWKGQIEGGGASADDVDEFRERKRYMRLIKAGCDPTSAHNLKNDRERTRRFLRLIQFGCAPAAALRIIDDDKAYRRFLLSSGNDSSRLKAFIGQKRGDGVPKNDD
jgi:hypothetical protein